MSVERVEIPVDPEVFAEWQSGLPSDKGVTLKELLEVWKCGERVARRRLRDANSAGVLQSGWRTVQDISGRQNRVPVYSFIERPKAGKKARAK